MSSTIDLTVSGLTAQLGDQFNNLCRAGGTNRVPFAHQATGGIYRHLAAQRGISASDEIAALAIAAQAQILVIFDFRISKSFTIQA